MKITESSELIPKLFRADDDEIARVCDRVDQMFKIFFKSKKFKNKKSKISIYMYIRARKKLTFLISSAKKTLNKLKQTFINTLIFQHFNLKNHIQIETNKLGYLINKILSKLSTNEIISNKSNLVNSKTS